MAENQMKTSSSSEPEMKGWLLKWTNYLKGYQRRWFVLSNGVLSYYRYVVDTQQLFFFCFNHENQSVVFTYVFVIHSLNFYFLFYFFVKVSHSYETYISLQSIYNVICFVICVFFINCRIVCRYTAVLFLCPFHLH